MHFNIISINAKEQSSVTDFYRDQEKASCDVTLIHTKEKQSLVNQDITLQQNGVNLS